jgi:hypothetical protein
MSSAATGSRVALFGYGSLVSPESAAVTLGRPVPAPVPAQLTGWRRRWSQCRDNLVVEKTFARRDDGTTPRHILGLNIEPSEDTAPLNGALLEVTEEELYRLDGRELRYDRVEVTDHVDPRRGFERVFAYAAKRPNHVAEPPPGAVVLAAYVRRVEAAFAELGPDQARLYHETTEPPGAEVIEAVLVRDRIRDGNPREW